MSELFLMSTGAMIGTIVAAVVLLLVIIIVAWGISTYNGLIKYVNNADEGWATIDVYLKKRYDLIPNLVETVKGYAKHETETLTNVINARNGAISASGADARMQAENELGNTLRSIFALSERYPELKADKQFGELREQLQKIENELAQSRKYYNATVKTYNTKIRSFPSNIIAKMMKLEKRVYFELSDDEERKNIKVTF